MKKKPEQGKIYYTIASYGDILQCEYLESDGDNWRISQGNYFETLKEAHQHLRNLETKAELQALADELNGGEAIVWNNFEKIKYYLIYKPYMNRLDYALANEITVGNIYCLHRDFLDKAIKRIGEQRLIEMIKSEV